MNKGLIFDMDGTLWDSAENVAKYWTETVQKEGYRDLVITKEAIMSQMGKPMDELAAAIFTGFEKEEYMRLLDICGTEENEYLIKHGGILYPNLEETLKKLMNMCDLFIVSNCQSGYIEAFLEHYKFEKYFKDIECYGNNLKQKGENIRLLAERNGLTKAYYVGDIQGDYDATMEAGYGFIHAAYGFGSVNADVPRINAFEELPELLETIGF